MSLEIVASTQASSDPGSPVTPISILQEPAAQASSRYRVYFGEFAICFLALTSAVIDAYFSQFFAQRFVFVLGGF